MVVPAVNLPGDFLKAVEIPSEILDCFNGWKIDVEGAKAFLNENGQEGPEVVFHFPNEKKPNFLSGAFNQRFGSGFGFEKKEDGGVVFKVLKADFEKQWSLE